MKKQKKIKEIRYKDRKKKFVDFKDIKALEKRIHAHKKKIVFTVGSFDLLNPAHCRYLAEAKSLGDILVVGVSTDHSDKKLKGDLYPLINEEIRAELVSYLKPVDYVILIDEYRPHAILTLLKPDVYFTNKREWVSGIRDDQESYLVKSYGGKMVVSDPYEPYITIQMLVDHIANIRVLKMFSSFFKEKIENFSLDSVISTIKPADYGNQTPRYKKSLDISDCMVDVSDLKKLREKYKSEGKKTVLVAGTFDLLHVGHARFIEQAGLKGDVLFVAVPSDYFLKITKGLGRPVINEKSRAMVVAHLDPVDYVTIFHDYTVYKSLEELKPDVFFTVDESWNSNYKESPEYKLVTSYGGKVIRAGRQAPFLSSSIIIDRVAYQKIKDIFKECMDEDRYKKVLSEKTVLK